LIRRGPDRPRCTVADCQTGKRRTRYVAVRPESVRLRTAEPAPERMPAFLHDRRTWGDSNPGASSPEGPHPPGCECLALPAPRRGPHGAGLCQRRLPDATLQPVRLLRGRSDAGVTTDAGYAEALRALAERGRFGIHLGLGRTRALLRELGDPQLGIRGALVEVGLGGRLDATHAWDGGVAAITNVDLDHTDRLGTTIAAIAREKAAIVERGDVAVTGATGEALAIVRRRAARLGVPLTVVT